MVQGKVRYAIIGLGMGRHHAIQLRKAAHAELAAICDLDPIRLERAGEEFGVPWRTGDYHELLGSPDIDAVVVALPNSLHMPVSVDALRAGKHVLCEKPMARDAEEAERMLLASRESGRLLMIHFNTRFTPPAMALHRYVEAGELGRIYHARTWWHRNRGIPGLGGWFTSKVTAGGGPLIDLGVHRLDLALWLMDYPKAVAVSGATYDFLGRELAEREQLSFSVEDMASGFVRFEDGSSLVLEASWAGNGEQAEEMLTQVYGTRAGLLHRNTQGYEYEARVFREEHGSFVSVAPQLLADDFDSPQEHFARCILEGRQPIATGEQGLEVMRILDALYLSAAEQREVRF